MLTGPFNNLMHRSREVRAAWLCCGKSPEGREFHAERRHPMVGNL